MLLLVLILCGVISGTIAVGKNRSFGYGFLLGFVLGIIGIIIVWCQSEDTSDEKHIQEMRKINENKRLQNARFRSLEKQIYNRSIQIKKCPQCAEDVKKEAKICRFCGFAFEL